MKVLIMQFLPSFYYFLPLGSKYLSQHPVFKHPQLPSSFSVREPDVMLFSVNGRKMIQIWVIVAPVRTGNPSTSP
jgi:hypothetical protein